MKEEVMEEGGGEGGYVRRYPMFDWASGEREGGREGREDERKATGRWRWDDENEVKEGGRKGGEEEMALSPILVIAGSPLFRVSEERERDRASSASMELIKIMARREGEVGKADGSTRTAAAGATVAAGKNWAMEGDIDRLVTLPSPPLLRLPFSAWQGEGGRGGESMRSEGSVDLWRIRRTLVASSEMQTSRTPSPVPTVGDNDSFTGTGEGGKEGGGGRRRERTHVISDN